MGNWTVYKREYASLQEVAQHYGMDYDKLEKEAKKQKGNDLSGIIRREHKFDLSYHGKTMSVKQIIKISGLSKETVEKRLTRRWSVEKIINTPVRTIEKTEPFMVDGEKYYSINALAKKYEIPQSTLLYRIKKLNMTAEEAVHAKRFQRRKKTIRQK